MLAAGLLCGGMTFANAAVGPPAPGGIRCVEAAGQYHVALVVQHSSAWSAPGEVLSRCVAFDSSTPTFNAQDRSITGEEVLRLSGLEYQDSGTYYGPGNKAVCQVDYEPQTYPPGCFDSTSPYWVLFVSRGGGGWTSSRYGISQQAFADGDAEGLHYGSQTSRVPPPPSPNGVCPPPQPAPSTITGTPGAGAPASATPGPAAGSVLPPQATAGPTGTGSTASGTTDSPAASPTPTSDPTTSAGDEALLNPTSPASGTPSRHPRGFALAPLTAATLPAGWLSAAAVAALMMALLVTRRFLGR